MDEPEEFCNNYYGQTISTQNVIDFPVEAEGDVEKEVSEELLGAECLPQERDKVSYRDRAPESLKKLIDTLPLPAPIESVLMKGTAFDLYIGAFGFEERTTAAVRGLEALGVKVNNALMLEFDRFYEAAEMRRAVDPSSWTA
jgi:hypothetical protein